MCLPARQFICEAGVALSPPPGPVAVRDTHSSSINTHISTAGWRTRPRPALWFLYDERVAALHVKGLLGMRRPDSPTTQAVADRGVDVSTRLSAELQLRNGPGRR